LRRDAGETEAAVHQIFGTLRENMAKQLKLLEKARVRRDLTEEELYLARQLKKDLVGMEEFLTDEVERLEKDAK
jgi:hypothetical protein